MTWEELMQFSVAGTQRPGAPEAKDILRRAARIALERRSASICNEVGVRLDAGEPEPANRIESVTPYLQLALAKFPSVLPEFFANLEQANLDLPWGALPEMLQNARREPDLVVPALGRRGRWLAQQNPDWNRYAGGFLDPEELAETYRTEKPAPRLAAFRRLHRISAKAAETLLEVSWPKESAEMRAALLAIVLEQPKGDEWIRRGLEDRSVPVRLVAQQGRARLAQEDFVGQVRELIAATLPPGARFLYPDINDRRWDDIGLVPLVGAGLSPREGLVAAVVAMRPPAEVAANRGGVEALWTSCESKAVRHGLREGAMNFNDQDHLAFLARLELKPDGPPAISTELWARLRKADREQLVMTGWKSLTSKVRYQKLEGFFELPEIWSEQFSQWVIQDVRSHLGDHSPDAAFWNRKADLAASLLHPSLIEEAQMMLRSYQADPRHPVLKSWFPILSLRRALLRPFEPKP